MQVYFSDTYTLPLPEGHRFPMQKYEMLRSYLLEHQILEHRELFQSPLAHPELLELAHTPEYIRQVQDGTLDKNIISRIGFPWSPALYDRSRATVGGAVQAVKAALKDGIAGNLAGGTHHAHSDRGEGYCVFNDIAVATRFLQKYSLASRIAIIDLDVHQGNGNSSILGGDPQIFILSVHGEKNYPFRKVPSTLDIALPDGASDVEFLKAVEQGLDAIRGFQPDYIFYQMGVDPLKEDVLGKLNVTHEGLKKRDRMVLSYCRDQSIPVSLALGGGYAKPIELSVLAYANTYRVTKEIFIGI